MSKATIHTYKIYQWQKYDYLDISYMERNFEWQFGVHWCWEMTIVVLEISVLNLTESTKNLIYLVLLTRYDWTRENSQIQKTYQKDKT
jgi:hypothetical protein